MIPSTYGNTDVRFTIPEKSITCYNEWNLTYQWSSADFDGSNEQEIADQTSLSFAQTISNEDPFLLILSVYASIDKEPTLVA